MIWSNTKLNRGLALGHYEIVKLDYKKLNRYSVRVFYKREFHLQCHSDLEGYPLKSKNYKFSSPQAARKAGWKGIKC